MLALSVSVKHIVNTIKASSSCLHINNSHYVLNCAFCCRCWRPVWRTAGTSSTSTCPPETLWRTFWSKQSCLKTTHPWLFRTESWSWYRCE